MAYDVYIKPLPEGEQTNGKAFTFGFKSAVGIQGAHKVALRFAKCLLTPVGTDILNPTYGTSFSDLVNANVRDLREALGFASLAVQDAADQVKALDVTAGLPPEESLESAVISRAAELEPDGIEIYVLITNTAGQSVQMPLPILAAR
jgi:hypothetical protein